MQDRIPGGRFVNEGLRVTCDNRSFDVESSSLCAVVANVQQKTVLQLSLYVKIPYLNVAQPILRIDGVIVRDRRGRSAREPVDECQITRGGIRDRVRFRDGKGRLKRKILNYRSVLREVVVDSIPEPNDGLLQGPPRQSEPRRNVISIRLNKRCREAAKSRTALAWLDGTRKGEVGTDIQIHDAIMSFRVRTVVFIT